MLLNPIVYNLQKLRLHSMAKAFKEQLEQPTITQLSFEERLGLLVDTEVIARENRQLQARLRSAKLQQTACLEDIDHSCQRNLDKSLLATLSQCQWVASHHNILIVGPRGTGKTFFACALAHKACLQGYKVHYCRLCRLLSELQIGKGDGRYGKRMSELAKTEVLILDDFGLSILTDEQRRDLLEVLDDRHDKRSTIVTSQIPVKLWHETIGNETLADAILDRLVHNSYRLEIKGESMRKVRSKEKDQENTKQKNIEGPLHDTTEITNNEGVKK
ncbi:IS21-like element helper ATPase IstB [Candidatus Finniella inopinata]|uniref:AAA family ATPase n=1 Tax=Candidatus Finniella inopinata TaxID=1696036 RepID=A0A4Q7DJZ0_9PROT|nr:AAA family ATPase [Candidatus Finniella inopinata]